MQFDTGIIKELIIKHLKKDITASEQDTLQSWLHASPENLIIFNELNDPDRLLSDLKELNDSKTAVLAKIEAANLAPVVNLPVGQPTVTHTRKRAWLYAAASLILLLTTGYFLLNRNHASYPAPQNSPAGYADIPPGSNKATLTLSGGSVIVLENTGDGNISRQGNTTIIKKKDQLAYSTAPQANSASAAPSFNTLTTPKAGQFQLLLPDGTKVWLNNSSSLRYPTAFTGARREVSLTGEAYFEVAQDAHKPFFVSTNRMHIAVLGTSFNIMAYDNERSTDATLVDGAVKVSRNGDPAAIALHPGEQARLDSQGSIKTMPANVNSVTAWKNGFFNFNHTGLQAALRQLARWYDIDILYKNAIPQKTFSGVIDRQLNLSQVLKIFESDEYDLALNGKTLIVSARHRP